MALLCPHPPLCACLVAVKQKHARGWFVSQWLDDVVALARFDYSRESLEAMRLSVSGLPITAMEMLEALFGLVSGPFRRYFFV